MCAITALSALAGKGEKRGLEKRILSRPPSRKGKEKREKRRGGKSCRRRPPLYALQHLFRSEEGGEGKEKREGGKKGGDVG